MSEHLNKIRSLYEYKFIMPGSAIAIPRGKNSWAVEFWLYNGGCFYYGLFTKDEAEELALEFNTQKK